MRTRQVKTRHLIVEDVATAGGGIPAFVAGGALVGATATQTLTNKTLTAPVITLPVSTTAATGNNQATAAAVAAGFVLVTAADATKGVKLPAAVAGTYVILKNNANAVLKLYPGTDDKINGGAANAEYTAGVAAYASMILVAYDATDWYTVPLLAS